MAFMMPVMKKDFDLYKNRRISESVPTRKMSAEGYRAASLSTSPSSTSAPAYGSPSSMAAFTQRMQNRAMTRTSSRASQNSLVTSPTRGGVGMTHSSSSNGCSPPKAGCSHSSTATTTKGSQGSLNKFHSRLVDKLKRSLKRESSTSAPSRSWEGSKSIRSGCKDEEQAVEGQKHGQDNEDVDSVAVDLRERLALTLTSTAGDRANQSNPRRNRSPSTTSLPVPEHASDPVAVSCGSRTVVAHESAASLIGSDSALLLIRDKPPLPRFGRTTSTTTPKKQKQKTGQQPDRMDTDDPQSGVGEEEGDEEVMESRRKSSKLNIFKGTLNFFKMR